MKKAFKRVTSAKGSQKSEYYMLAFDWLWWNGMMFENFEWRNVAHLLKIVRSLVCTIFCIDSKKKGPKCARCFGEVFLILYVLSTAVLDTWHTSGIYILVPQAETMSVICLVFVGEVQHGLFQKCHYNGIPIFF